jgi:hypothetical protein
MSLLGRYREVVSRGTARKGVLGCKPTAAMPPITHQNSEYRTRKSWSLRPSDGKVTSISGYHFSNCASHSPPRITWRGICQRVLAHDEITRGLRTGHRETRRFPVDTEGVKKKSIIGRVVRIELDVAPYKVPLFFTAEHASVWLTARARCGMRTPTWSTPRNNRTSREGFESCARQVPPRCARNPKDLRPWKPRALGPAGHGSRIRKTLAALRTPCAVLVAERSAECTNFTNEVQCLPT